MLHPSAYWTAPCSIHSDSLDTDRKAENSPLVTSAGSPEECSASVVVVPGESGEPAFSVLLSCSDVVQIASAGGHNEMTGVAGAQVRVYCGKKG